MLECPGCCYINQAKIEDKQVAVSRRIEMKQPDKKYIKQADK
jgi:hypothetical protein